MTSIVTVGALCAKRPIPPDTIPTIAYAVLGSDISTSSTTFSNVVTCSLTVSGTSDKVDILASMGWNCPSVGNTPTLRITVDGVDVGQSASTEGNGSGFGSTSRVVQVTGLSAGAHTINLDWRSGVSGHVVGCQPVSDPTTYHAAIVARIANASVYSAASTSLSSTATSATDTLISSVSYTTLAATSALYIRFSACGLSTANASVPLFQVFVDGVGQTPCTADMGDGATFTFNAGLVLVVPVTIGAHTVVVKWGGSAAGSTIDASTAPQHACIYIDEVFTSSDVAAISLPRPKYSHLTTDVVAPNTLTSVSVSPAATTLYFIEATASGANAVVGSVQCKLTIGGTDVAGCRSGSVTNAGRNTVCVTHVASLAAGAHTIALTGVTGTFNASSASDSEHAALLVWAVTT